MAGTSTPYLPSRVWERVGIGGHRSAAGTQKHQGVAAGIRGRREVAEGAGGDANLCAGRVSWGDWGSREEQAVYSSQVIRQARILPDRLSGQGAGNLPGTQPRAAAAGADAGHAVGQARCPDTDKERGAFARNATVCAEGYAGPVF
jgi:hypothetical protein